MQHAPLPSGLSPSSQLSIMEAFLACDYDTSYAWEDDEELFTLTLPYVPLLTGSSSISSGDDNNVELSNE